ncbi:anthranilate synthase component 2 [Tindallia magadiensis]|uniref:Anthranilate synthase component 2 n=1 Tax=Tindallia magadiensis TaxID=69895 RepID=A0A1I3B000_9FIRM|nr:aminodeoxychorismate/anthranilate synthase component II [Tindallia magadiensis]SFH55552.1 anthranilate synthase component 2 [Tindallia magadiensis]
MIIILDNYDSFTYNLFQYIGEINPKVKVIRNKEVTVHEIERMNPSHIVVSPGPGFPTDAGISIDLIRTLSPRIPTLGICLGHQAIGEAYGGKVVHAARRVHGKTDKIYHTDSKIFKGIPTGFHATRYHSLVVKPEGLPDELKVTAVTDKQEIMAMEHEKYPVYGLQFHPESLATEYGKEMIRNFLRKEIVA